MPHVTSAQNPDPETDVSLTAEDIAAGVKTVKPDKAKIKTYCDVMDMLDDAEGDEETATKPVDPKVEEVLDAKVEKILVRWVKISVTPIMR